MLKNKRLIILTLSISLIFLYGCTTKSIEDNNLNNNKTARLPIEYTYDFEDGLDGWSGGFAGATENNMKSGYTPMVKDGDNNLSNGNSRGMYSTRKFDKSDGLRPNTDYVVDFKFDLASNTRGINNNAYTGDTNNVTLRDNNLNDLGRNDTYNNNRNDLDLHDNDLNNFDRDNAYNNDRNDLLDNDLNDLGRDDIYNNNRNDLNLHDNDLNNFDGNNAYNNDRNDLDLLDNDLNDLDRNDAYTRDTTNLDLMDNNLNGLDRNDAYTRDTTNLDLMDNNLNGLDRNDAYTIDGNDLDFWDNNDNNTLNDGTYTRDRGVNTIVGEKVYVKAGVVNVEPKGDGTKDMLTLGNAAIDGINDNSVYNQKSYQQTFYVTTNENGELWAIIGMDSSNNGASKLYLDNVAITIDKR